MRQGIGEGRPDKAERLVSLKRRKVKMLVYSIPEGQAVVGTGGRPSEVTIDAPSRADCRLEVDAWSLRTYYRIFLKNVFGTNSKFKGMRTS